MESGGGPPCRIQLVPVASIIILPHAAVRCPPAPLQSARLAAQVCRDLVAKCIRLGKVSAGWQVEALWVPDINRLAIGPSIVRNAVSFRLCTNQRPLIGALVAHCCVANLHLKVTEVVCCDHMLKLCNLSTCVSRTDGFFWCCYLNTICSLPLQSGHCYSQNEPEAHSGSHDHARQQNKLRRAKFSKPW